MKEAALEIQPFHSGRFYGANAALSFHHMNGDEPLKTSPYHEDGRLERLELIRDKLPGIDEVISRVPPRGAGVVHMYRRRRCCGRHAGRRDVP